MRRVARGVVLVAAVLAVSGAVGADGTAPSQQPPDISGVWGARFLQSLNDTDVPFLPAGKKAFDARNTDEDPTHICKPPGIPRLMNLNFLLEVVQTPKVVYFLMEYNQHTRRVYIDGKHPADVDPTWHGHSIGHWEGQTLVVDTIGFNDQTWLDMRGHQHGEKLHVTERFTLTDDGKGLKYDVTIEDPEFYSKPWQSVSKVFPRRTPDTQIQEFICET